MPSFTSMVISFRPGFLPTPHTTPLLSLRVCLNAGVTQLKYWFTTFAARPPLPSLTLSFKMSVIATTATTQELLFTTELPASVNALSSAPANIP